MMTMIARCCGEGVPDPHHSRGATGHLSHQYIKSSGAISRNLPISFTPSCIYEPRNHHPQYSCLTKPIPRNPARNNSLASCLTLRYIDARSSVEMVAALTTAHSEIQRSPRSPASSVRGRVQPQVRSLQGSRTCHPKSRGFDQRRSPCCKFRTRSSWTRTSVDGYVTDQRGAGSANR